MCRTGANNSGLISIAFEWTILCLITAHKHSNTHYVKEDTIKSMCVTKTITYFKNLCSLSVA